jgi:hypothetical protein
MTVRSKEEIRERHLAANGDKKTIEEKAEEIFPVKSIRASLDEMKEKSDIDFDPLDILNLDRQKAIRLALEYTASLQFQLSTLKGENEQKDKQLAEARELLKEVSTWTFWGDSAEKYFKEKAKQFLNK